ncbi:MAG: glycosyltransferase family 39 protein [Bacteroidota bacterium]
MQRVNNAIISYYKSNPLVVILLVGLFFRLLATVFSMGYGWHDDQFLIVEIAQSWVDGIDYYSWLPSADGTRVPEGFSFFYVGIHYLLFIFFEFVGINDPQIKMLFVRWIHALWSILVIYYGFKITLQLSNLSNAKLVGWILAVFWIFPMISVRNLVEYVNIPLMLYGLWLVIKNEKNTSYLPWLWAGIIFGIAFNIRFQTMLITGAIGLVTLIHGRWKSTFFLGIGVLIPIIIIQGGVDYFTWDKPFIQLIEYVNYNLHNAANYIVSPWYTYLLFLAGILIPPVSLFILAGFFQQWRKLLIIFFPILLFLIFHSYYPNKQERFVITIVPMLIIIGVIGWQQIKEKYFKSSTARSIVRYSWVFFWVINFIVLLPITVMYSKKARVESMSYMSQYGDINNFLIEDINQTVLRFPPQFYLGNWYNYNTLMKDDIFSEFVISNSNKPVSEQPGFVLFYQPDEIEDRVSKLKTVYPELEFETIIEPGFMDRVMHWLNPINDNQNIYLYRNKEVLPERISQ